MKNEKCKTQNECRGKHPPLVRPFFVFRFSFFIRPSSPIRARRAPAGFSLLELVLVMAVLCAILLMVAPSLSNFGAGRQADEAASQIVALAQWARGQAISEGRTYRLNFDSTNGSFYLTAQTGGLFERLGTEFGRVFQLPEGVQLTYNGPMEGGLGCIDFYPTGRAEPVTIRLTQRSGETTDIACASPTEQLRILAPGEAVAL